MNASPSPTFSLRGLQLSRRQFLTYTAGTLGVTSLGSLVTACNSSKEPTYPISSSVHTTDQKMLSFPASLPGLTITEITDVASYAAYGYGEWTFGAGLPIELRTDHFPDGHVASPVKRKKRLAHFFAFSDIHITDKEAPNQFAYFQQVEPSAANNTSIYSPVMLYTTHVLDAAIQTINALHREKPFDFGLSLGDAANNTSYLELRWYLDVIDGKRIHPSSGAHLGADSVDFQKPYQAAGLDKSIPWYQAIGNHDHFFIGSFPVDADPELGIRESFLADHVWSVGDVLAPNLARFPAMFNIANLQSASPAYYPGVLDGSSPYGDLIHFGDAADPKFADGAPKVAADASRRSLLRSEWIDEFFRTDSWPSGHGFDLVDRSNPAYGPGFACYSFVPNAAIPLKVIVLDDTQSELDGSIDIHGHGYLDATRWEWLKAELAAGQENHQLMIIAAHIPICVSTIGSETEWWAQTDGIAPEHRNACTLTELVDALRAAPNLLMWVAGHRHVNTAKAVRSADRNQPEYGFWHVETSSLRDFPQQFRTFEIFLNDDDTISIVALNVDPAVAEGTPAAVSRRYAIAVQQIVQQDMHPNGKNAANVFGMAVPTMDPSRPQDGNTDETIRYVDLSTAATKPVPYHASYNAELLKPLAPAMVAELRKRFG